MWANSVRKAGEREFEDCLLEYRETKHRPLRQTWHQTIDNKLMSQWSIQVMQWLQQRFVCDSNAVWLRFNFNSNALRTTIVLVTDYSLWDAAQQTK